MICEPCQQAGSYNQSANEPYNGHVKAILQQSAKENHTECKGGCDCQHVVGQALNIGRMNAT